MLVDVYESLHFGTHESWLGVGRCSFLSTHFKDVFEKKEEWGLATLLLHEHAKGNESRWCVLLSCVWPAFNDLDVFAPLSTVGIRLCAH